MQQNRQRWKASASLLSLLKRLRPYWLAGLALLFLLSGCNDAGNNGNGNSPNGAPVNSSGVPHVADTWNNIHLFLTFDYNISDPAAIAKHYDFVWGASVKNVSAFRTANPQIFLTYYISFFRDTGVYGNNQPRSLAYWKSTHPDWILYRCDRTTPAYEFGDPNVPLDIANPAVVAWQVQTYAEPASKGGYDGIAADNVSLENLSGACGTYVNGKWVQRYTGQPNDPQWSADVITWLTRMQQALHQLSHPLALVTNLTISNMSESVAQQVISHTDGVLDESGFTNSGDSYLTGNDWVQAIQFMQNVQQQGKDYFVINEFSSVGPTETQWAVASYLMGKDHSSSVYISPVQAYGSDIWTSDFDTPIGSPDGSMYQTQGVYARAYSNGQVLVNPSATASYTVTLPTGNHYRDLYGDAISGTVSMPPHSGLVLVRSS